MSRHNQFRRKSVTTLYATIIATRYEERRAGGSGGGVFSRPPNRREDTRREPRGQRRAGEAVRRTVLLHPKEAASRPVQARKKVEAREWRSNAGDCIGLLRRREAAAEQRLRGRGAAAKR